MSKDLMLCEVRPEGFYIKSSKKRGQFKYLNLTDIRIKLDDKPEDPNRFKAINENWLPWAENREVSFMPSRLLVNCKFKGKSNVYVKIPYKLKK